MKKNDDINEKPLTKQELKELEAARDRMAEMRVRAAAQRAAEQMRDEQMHQEQTDEAGREALDVEQPIEKPRKKRKQSTIGSVLSGSILTRRDVRTAYPLLIFGAALMFLYIANAFRGQRIYREHAELTEQVKELRSQSMTIASEKMQQTRQSNIIQELERRGIPLKESLTPNKVIPR